MSNIETIVGENRPNMVAQFFPWWIGALASLVSAPLAKQRSWRVLLLKTTEGLDVCTRDAKGIKHIGALAHDTPQEQIQLLQKACQRHQSGAASIILRLSSKTALQKNLTFPKATLDVIEPVLHNQMERIAPWPQAETRFGYEILEDDQTTSDQLNVAVIITSQTILDEALDQAKQIGLVPGRIDFGEDAQAPSGIRLVTMEDNGRRKTQNFIGFMLGALLVLSLVICGWGISVVMGSQETLAALDEQIAQTRQRAGQVRKLAAENTELRRRRLRLIKRKQEEASTIVVMETLSRVLPDTAWLTGLEINKSNVQLFGLASNAASLITMLENTPFFSNVQFSASTTRRSTDKKEIFSIKAQAVQTKLPVE